MFIKVKIANLKELTNVIPLKLSNEVNMNKDKIIEFSELSNFVSDNVKKQAAINGREQTPQFINNTGKVLVNLN